MGFCPFFSISRSSASMRALSRIVSDFVVPISFTQMPSKRSSPNFLLQVFFHHFNYFLFLAWIERDMDLPGFWKPNQETVVSKLARDAFGI